MFKHIILTSLLFISFNSIAATKAKVTMPETVTIKGKELVLNGLGIRKATFFGIKVYVGGLYLEKKSKDANSILSAKGPKYLRMHFVRDVKGEKLIGGWNEAFGRAVKNLAPIQPQIDQFNKLMGNIKKNEEIVLHFSKKGVEVDFANKKAGTVKGGKFATALLSVWFINAKDEGLRDGLLGL